MPFGIRITTRWVASDNPEFVCPDFRAWSLAEPSEEIRVTQRKCG